MDKSRKIILFIAIILLIGFLAWYFSSLVVYLVTSIMLSFVGSPLVKLLKKVKIGKFHLPVSVCATITLILMVIFFASIIIVFIPIIVSQADVFTNLDFTSLAKSFEERFKPLEQKLIQFHLLSQNQKIINIVSEQIFSFLKMLNMSDMFSGFVSVTGNLFIGTFAVLFTTFFLLKDEHIVYNLIMLIAPEKYHNETENILQSSKRLLSRYFIGLLIDILVITTGYSIGLSALGIKNALLIASIGGILHVIPYLGPLIGVTLGSMLGIATALAGNPNADILSIILIIAGVFAAVNMLDNFVFQPLIYSNSVKAHPLEIFFIILIGDAVGGILGMILAIPMYTLVRIVLKEFLFKFRIVQKLTEKI